MLNVKAAAHALRGKHEEAEKVLLAALDKAPNDADSLLNLATVSRLSGKGSEVCHHRVHLRDAQGC
jgi:hypothetical protein